MVADGQQSQHRGGDLHFRGSLPGRHSRAITGRHTGRARNGSSTTRPTTTKQVPRPTGLGPFAAPSCCQAAPNTFLPPRLNSVSSTATVSATPSGSRARTIRWDRQIPRMSGLQRARAKKACARSWDHARVRPAPVSIPVTVHRPVCAIKPVTRPAKVAKVGVVKQPRTTASTASNEVGIVGSGSIGASLHRRHRHRRCFPLRQTHPAPTRCQSPLRVGVP